MSEQLVAEIGARLKARGETVSTAESCTGGLLAAALTSVAGSSAWFEQGYVVYANRAKHELLDVPEAFLQQFGAVSEPVVAALAQRASEAAGARWALAVSGIAGPDGGSADKPVGTVWFALAGPDGIATRQQHFAGDRTAVRAQAVDFALGWLSIALQNRVA